MKTKEWNKIFWNKFPTAVGNILYKNYVQGGIPPEILLDFLIEDDEHIKKLLFLYYGDIRVVSSFSKNQIELIREYLRNTLNAFEDEYI